MVGNEKIIDINDFCDGEIDGVVFKSSHQLTHLDERGCLAEVARSDEDGEVPMVYVSTTEPGVIRGPHEHRAQTDRFLFIGQATVWLWDNRGGSPTYKNRYMIRIPNSIGKVVVPPGVVHAYRADANMSRLVVVNAPDKLYKGHARQEPVDEVRYEDDPQSRFQPW